MPDMRAIGKIVKCCPINEQTADGTPVGRCWMLLEAGRTCPRHGDVSVEVERMRDYGTTTLENVMRKRKGLSCLGKDTL